LKSNNIKKKIKKKINFTSKENNNRFIKIRKRAHDEKEYNQKMEEINQLKFELIAKLHSLDSATLKDIVSHYMKLRTAKVSESGKS
jgi:hypothetical protein